MKNLVIQQIIKRLSLSVSASNNVKFILAKDLFWARYAIEWNKTSYKGWGEFCEKHINLARCTINNYVTVGAKITKFKYTDKQCIQIIKKINWSRFKYGLMNQEIRTTPAVFIEKYKNWQCTTSGSYKPNSDRAYVFSLPSESADKLDSYLHSYGMTNGEKCGYHSRRGVRTAMIKLIDTQLD